MSLYFTWECMKCKCIGTQILLDESNNPKYSDERNFCQHFNISMDVSNIGKGRSNQITIKAIYKPNNSIKTLIDKSFNEEYTEYQNYTLFGDVILHGRISENKGLSPIIGNYIQQANEYKKKIEEKKKKDKIKEPFF